MNTTTPPKILYGKHIELFGPKGREIYQVDRVEFYNCKEADEQCIHDISIIYRDSLFSYYFIVHNVSYDDLVRQNYISYFTNTNKKLLDVFNLESKCKLFNLPEI